jgi:hypothetical protein
MKIPSIEEIEQLPNWYELDKIKAGDFAKRPRYKATSSLVYILKNEGTTVNFAFLSSGVVNVIGYSANVIKEETQEGISWKVTECKIVNFKN